jgi:hypothetical protein
MSILNKTFSVWLQESKDPLQKHIDKFHDIASMGGGVLPSEPGKESPHMKQFKKHAKTVPDELKPHLYKHINREIKKANNEEKDPNFKPYSPEAMKQISDIYKPK